MDPIDPLRAFVERHQRLFVLTGAGCSTASGIPDYRDRHGEWKRPPPVTYQAFTRDAAVRKRYWARGMIGWRSFRAAEPNAAHRALAALERTGRCTLLLTQNVDRLHQRAGSRNVIDLHGRLDQVRCLQCGERMPREAMQAALEARNPDWIAFRAADAPDGDADLDGPDFTSFAVPDCDRCSGMLKPDCFEVGSSWNAATSGGYPCSWC